MTVGAEPDPVATTVIRSIAIEAPVDEVWHVVRDVGAIGDWLPGVESSRLEEDIRVVEYIGGGEARERILGIDDVEHTYTYRLVSGRLPLESYEARFSVEALADGAGTVVHWIGSFVPKNPDDAGEIADALHGFYESSLDVLGRKFADIEEKEK